MTFQQGAAFAIVLGTMALLVWGRIRYDLVALLALLVSIAAGVVAPDKAFAGFGDEIVIIVASALLVSAAVARSGVVERLMRPINPYLTDVRAQVFTLVMAVTLLSAFMKNIGALAIFMPVAFQLVGFGIALAGVLFLSVGYRLLPGGRRGAASPDAAFNIESYTTEAVLPATSPLVGKTVRDPEAVGEGEVRATTIIRERVRRYTPTAQWTLYAGDVLLLEGEPDALERVIVQAGLELAGDETPSDAASDDI